MLDAFGGRIIEELYYKNSIIRIVFFVFLEYY